MAGLIKLVTVTQIVFGTDYPLQPSRAGVEGLAELGLSAEDMRAIESGNARKLVPRLQS